MGRGVDEGELAAVVRALFGAATAIVDWEAEPIAYAVYLPGRSLTSVRGRAIVAGNERTFAAVRKLRERPDGGGDEWRREAEAYRSARFAEARLGLRAARAYLIVDEPDAISLWLEELRDEHEHNWPLDAYAEAARALGRFNGGQRDVDALQAWMSRDWIDKHALPSVLANALPALEARCDAAAALDEPERLRRFLREQPRFAARIATLPQAICHHDAAQANLFLQRTLDGAREVVAIDWEGVGAGALGADLATLVCGTMRRGDFPAAAAVELDRVASAAYLEGLRDAGADDATCASARLGYATAVALRWTIVAATIDALAEGKSAPPLFEVARFVLARADEATTGLR